MNNTPHQPLVSVVMPIRNEERFIRRTLDCVLRQDYPAERIEVLVADGMSTDGTRDIVRSLADQHLGVRLLDNPRIGAAAGLNVAIREARGEVIIWIPGHTETPSDYVRICVEELLRTGADHVGGSMTPVGQGPFGEAVALATSTRFGIGGSQFHFAGREEWVDTVYMGAWRRQAFERFGLFDEEVGCSDDDEHNFRMRKLGGRILLSPRLKSAYTPRNAPGALARQYFRYGLWKVRVLQKHPRQMRLSHFVPPAFAAALLVSALWSAWSTAGLVAFGAAAGAYLAANLTATFSAGFRHGWKHARFLPLIYAVLHLSYGFGFLTGLIRFAGRWGDKAGRVPDLKTNMPDKAEVPT